MADRSALDMAGCAPKQEYPESAQASHSPCKSYENTVGKECRNPLLPVVDSFGAIYPEAAYIATAAASQIIANNISTLEQKGENQSAIKTSIAPSALALVNRFLDKLLFDTLSNSQTLAMPSIRPAIVEVLKPNFGASAIQRADLELKEYLDGSEDCILSDMQEAIDLVSNVDVYVLWKQTRLRCMLYSSLGEMEDEDSILYGNSLVPVESMMISPAVAIFLTSVLEFMGEQILAVAGRAAHRRLESGNSNSLIRQKNDFSRTVEFLTVEVLDVEYIAFDRLLGELWRTWKENKGFTATCSPRSRKGSHVSSRSLPLLRNLQQEDDQILQTRKELYPSVLNRLAHLDLAIQCQTSNVSCEVQKRRIDIHTQPNICNSTFSNFSKPTRPKSCSFISIENNTYVPHAKKRRANSMPQTAQPWPPRALKRPKPYSKADKKYCQQTANNIYINRTGSSISKSSLISTEENSKGLNLNEIDSQEEKPMKKLNPITCRSEDLSIDPNCTAPIFADVPKTAKTQSFHNASFSFTKGENKAQFHCPEKLISNQCNNFYSIGRSPQSFDKFKSSNLNNASGRPRGLSYHGRPCEKLFIRKRYTSMCTLNGIKYDQYGIDHSIFPSPPSSRTFKVCNISEGDNSERHLNDDNKVKHSSENDLLTRKITKLFLNESNNEGDESISPEIANFAVAMQGVDIYNLDIEYVPVNKEDDTNDIKETQSTLWYTKPYLNDYVRKRLSEHESDGNVSPVSLPIDEPISDGRVSPVSTVSSMEKMSDHEISSRSHRRNLISKSVEEATPEYQLSLSAPLSSNPVTTSKYNTHSINSRSSSRSHKVKGVFNNEENALGKFDQLIKSDQTIQYTLTPETVRDAEIPDHRQRFIQKNSEQGSILMKKASSSSSKYVAIETSQIKPFPTKASPVCTSESGSKSTSLIESKRRSCAPQPRDARIERDRSLSDFAKFIRTTGPDISTQNNPITLQETITVENQPPTGSNIIRNSSSRNTFHKRFDSASTRRKFPSRDIISKRSESFSSFIDFVRPGPKSENLDPSTSHDQASFNSPALSNSSWGVIDNKNVESSLIDPRQLRDSPSINSSVTSHSALLAHKAKKRSSATVTQNQLEKNNISSRRERKIRDTSLDLSDVEKWGDDSIETKPKQIESLKDFLQNTSPSDIPENRFARKPYKANASAPGLMSLFGRRPVSPKSSSKGLLGSIVSHQSTAYSSGSRKTINSRPALLSSYSSQVNVPRTNFSHRSFEPRDPTSRVRTDELAKFLMHNDPPSINGKNTSSPLLMTKNLKADVQLALKNEAGSFQRMFSRRRTSTISKS
ncbi:hypothetical protein EV44_g1352 [Erysiphe necator]|uniref:Uncharacterized protein n=1 Tax=Uncinula necator TaxID=52586 RepID=A0A0B1P975_UNCNE|nr:hypothetical protein EV44_g1352 [Erysiphe necator]